MSDIKEYHIAISKTELGEMPPAHFDGKIILIDNPDEVADAVDVLRNTGKIGFDTETRPSFHKGQLNNVALLQLSTDNTCYLFRINVLGLNPDIRDLLEDQSVMKIGLSTHDDIHNLKRIEPISPKGFVELQDYVDRFGIKDKSLSKIYAILFQERISKGQRLTNWEASELSEHQQGYAALDAYACLKIYDYLESGKFIKENCPFKVFHHSETPHTEERI